MAIMRLTTAAVFSAIAVLSILQYKWAVNSGEKTINDLAKSYEFRIFGSLAQEISRIDLFNLRPGGKDIPSGDDIRSGLEYMDSQFEMEYTGKFILFLAYCNLKDGAAFFSYERGFWKEGNREIFDRLLTGSDHGEPDFHEISTITDPETPGMVYLLRRYPGGNYVSLIHFDLRLFIERELFPVVNKNLDNYSINLISKLEPDMVLLENHNYRFSPVKTLISYIGGNEQVYYMNIPFLRLPIYRVSRDPDQKPPSEEIPGAIFLALQSTSGESLFFERELSIAVQWLTGLLLLLGIGGAYSLILFQKNRLTRLRRKEKEFVATISHELRTPLTVIHSAADNIQSGILSSEKLIPYGDLIKEQSARLSSMIEGILLFSRLEGKAEQAPILQKVDFQLIKEELELFFSSLHRDGRIKMSVDFGSLPTCSMTDRETLVLALTNLITNSFRHGYSKDETGEIRLSAHLKMPATLIFSVDDDGYGISRKEQKHLFEPFFRGDRSFREQIKGSGLGLYLVSRKVKLLGGSVNVESPYVRTDGKSRSGTSFTLLLPYIEAVEENRL